MQVTIKHIADSVGVSQMTVSRVLRGSGRVKDDTRCKVLAAADDLGYGANNQILLSGRLRNGKRDRCLKLILPFFGHAGRYSLSHEAESPTKNHLSLSERFNNSLASVLEESGGWLEKVLVESPEEFEKSWSRWDADGIVLRQPIPTDWLRKLQQIAPVVYASSHDTQNGVDVIYTNEHRSAANIFTYLSENGHRNIAWLDVIYQNGPYSVNINPYTGQELPISEFPPLITSIRQAAWANIRFLAGDDFTNEIMILKRDYRKYALLDVAHEALEQIMSMNPLPTAIVCAHDSISVSMLEAIRHRGMDVPTDISLVGYCGFEAAINSNPSISTVELPMEEIGAVVPELIERRLANPNAKAVSLQFETKLLKGGSVKDMNCKSKPNNHS